MAKGSDNKFPSVLLQPGAVPDTPDAGLIRIFVDEDDLVFKRVDDTGAVSTLSAPASTSLAYAIVFGV